MFAWMYSSYLSFVGCVTVCIVNYSNGVSPLFLRWQIAILESLHLIKVHFLELNCQIFHLELEPMCFCLHPRRWTARPWKPWWLEDDPFLLGFGNFSGVNSLLNFRGPGIPRTQLTSILITWLENSWVIIPRFALLVSVWDIRIHLAKLNIIFGRVFACNSVDFSSHVIDQIQNAGVQKSSKCLGPQTLNVWFV